MSKQLFGDFIQDDFYSLKPCSGSVLLKEIAKEKECCQRPVAQVACVQWKPIPPCKLPNVHDFQRKVREDAITGATFSESKFISCYDNGHGRPKVYEATKQIASAPNGIKQVIRTEKDQGLHQEKMSVGRHIRDKSHIEERWRNTKTGQENRFNEYHNMTEVEKHHFPQEWRNKTTGLSLEFARDPFTTMKFSNCLEYCD